MYYKEHNKDVRGLDRDTEVVELNKELLQLKALIDEKKDQLIGEIGELKTGLSTVDIQRKGRDILSSYVDLVGVKKVNERELGSKLSPDASMFGNMYDEMSRFYREAELSSPYSIPVEYDRSGSYYGRVECVQPNPDKADELLVDSIHLPRNKNEYLPQVYIRELVDLQVRTTKGAVQDVNNQDIVGLFYEYLSLSNDELKNKIYKYVVYTSLSDNIDYLLHISGYTDFNSIKDHIQKCSTKIISALKVFDLIDLFNWTDMIGQMEILDDMQMVIDGVHSLEDVLDKYNITQKRGMFVLKSNIKNN